MRRIPSIIGSLRAAALLLSILWLPLPFLSFDDHHDGLILATVTNFQHSLLNHGDWPFNQYGSFWIFAYGLPTLMVPSHFIFITLRLITVGCYFVTAFLCYKLMARLISRRMALVCPLLFFASQPFVASQGSSLVPWPSAIAMPLILGVGLLVLEKEGISKSNTRLVWAGILSTCILFTRVQVGLLTIIGIALLLVVTREWKKLFAFVVSAAASTLMWLYFLWTRGWLETSLRDQFLFGSTYLQTAQHSFHIPIFTIVGSLLVMATWWVTEKRFITDTISRSKSGFYKATGAISVLIAIALIALLVHRKLSLGQFLVAIERRGWICLIIGSVGYFLLRHVNRLLRDRRNGIAKSSKAFSDSALIVLSVAALSQGFPLFDQMHIWWGSVPGIILVVRLLGERLDVFEVKKRTMEILVAVGTGLMLIAAIVPWISQISEPREKFPNFISQVWVPEAQAQAERELSSFLFKTIPSGGSVLNLCGNANVFFTDKSRVSASRNFVVWQAQLDIPVYRAEIVRASPDYIVSCTSQSGLSFATLDTQIASKIESEVFQGKGRLIDSLQIAEVTWKVSSAD